MPIHATYPYKKFCFWSYASQTLKFKVRRTIVIIWDKYNYSAHRNAMGWQPTS